MYFPIEIGQLVPLDNKLSAEFTRWVMDNVKAASKSFNLNITQGLSGTGGTVNLHSVTFPAGLLQDIGNVIEFEVGGLMAANANNKDLQIIFGGSILYDSGALAANNKPYRIRAVIFTTGAVTQISTVDGFLNAAAVAPAHLTNLAIASSGAITMTSTALVATTAGDITEYWARTEIHQTLNDSRR